MLGRHDTDDTVTPSPVSSLSNGTTGLVDVCTALPSGLCSKDLATQKLAIQKTKQEYTVISIPISHFPYMEFASLSAQLSSLLQLFKLLCFVIVFKLDKGSSLNYSASTQVLDWVKPYHYGTYLPFLYLRYCVKSHRNLSIPGQSSRRLSPC